MAEKEGIWQQALGRRTDCPPPEELEKYLNQPDDLPLNSHVQQCVGCQGELTLLKEFLEVRPRPEEEQDVVQILQELRRRKGEGPLPDAASPVAPVVSLQAWKRRLARPGFGLAAIAAAALLIFVGVRVSTGPRTLVEPQTEILRSGQLIVEAPVGSLSNWPRELTLQPVPDATIYRIVLYDVGDVPVWSATSEVPQLELPETLRAIVLPGKTLFWQVTAVNQEGKVLADSDRVWVRLELEQ
jgi:hypothetical protein